MVARRAPEAPSGCPSAMAPPTDSAGPSSAPVSICHASGTGANASLTSKASISSIVSPERSSASAVAGIGPVSILTGSSPVTTAVWTRASGVRPSALARSEVMISSAAAPSEICDALPAVIEPPSRNGALSSASFSTVDPRRIPSSSWTNPSPTATGTISVGEQAGVLGGGGPFVRGNGVLVELGPRELVLGGDPLRAGALVEATVEPGSLQLLGVPGHCRSAELSRALDVGGSHRDAGHHLDASGDDDVRLA